MSMADQDVLTHTLHYGCGVFEGIRAYETSRGTAVFRLREHIDRLFQSAHILNMRISYDKETLTTAILETLRANKLKDAYIRPLCFYGPEGLGLRAENLSVHTIVAAWKWGSYLGKESIEKGIRVHTSSFTRHHVNISMCRAKANGHYINSMLALQDALRCGYDEALMLDAQGFVAEGSAENIFIVRNGKLYTPTLTSALEGITRDSILHLAQEIGYTPVEKQITRDEVYIADEVFFTGTAAEVTPVREIDGRVIGSGQRGPITKKIQAVYFDQVHGRAENHPEWLTYLGN